MDMSALPVAASLELVPLVHPILCVALLRITMTTQSARSNVRKIKSHIIVRRTRTPFSLSLLLEPKSDNLSTL